jgi:hypothetical protein
MMLRGVRAVNGSPQDMTVSEHSRSRHEARGKKIAGPKGPA